MKNLIVPFTLGAIVIVTSLALSFLQVRKYFPQFIEVKTSLGAPHTFNYSSFMHHFRSWQPVTFTASQNLGSRV
jgi:hypothetical protein